MTNNYRCIPCGSYDLTLHEYQTFKYWYCNQCKNEVKVANMSYIKQEEKALLSDEDPAIPDLPEGFNPISTLTLESDFYFKMNNHGQGD